MRNHSDCTRGTIHWFGVQTVSERLSFALVHIQTEFQVFIKEGNMLQNTNFLQWKTSVTGKK